MRQYIFDCSSCGGEISSNKGYLPHHSGKCRHCSQRKRPYQTAYGNLLGNVDKGRHKVTLTYEEFYELCKIPDCHYCNKPLNRSIHRKDTAGYRAYLIDRKDNSIGYTKENCVPCCGDCNFKKGFRYSYEEFVIISQSLNELRRQQTTLHWTEELAWWDGDDCRDIYYAGSHL